MSKLAPDYAVPLLGWLTLELNMSLKEMRNVSSPIAALSDLLRERASAEHGHGTPALSKMPVLYMRGPESVGSCIFLSRGGCALFSSRLVVRWSYLRWPMKRKLRPHESKMFKFHYSPGRE